MATKGAMSPSGGNEIRLARGLGWFSVGLGLAEFLIPSGVAALAGVRRRRGLIRLFGLREIGSGIAILMQRRPAGALWSRVAGDVLDLGALGSSLTDRKANRARVIAATATVCGVTALDVYASRQLGSGSGGKRRAFHVEKSITIDRSREELYSFWRRFENLTRFMTHLKSVQPAGENRSHWVAKGPAGTFVEWDAEIVEDRPNEVISWRSVNGADAENAGEVRFERAPGGRGTIVRVRLDYTPPAGALGAYVAKIFGEAPEKQIAVDLHRFKQLMETGEIARTEGQPAGRPASTSPVYDDFVRA
jgi:uncharacterized membrane protein